MTMMMMMTTTTTKTISHFQAGMFMIRLHVQAGNVYCHKPTALRFISTFIPVQSTVTWTCSANYLPLPSNEFLTNTSSSCSFVILSSDLCLHIVINSLMRSTHTTSSYMLSIKRRLHCAEKKASYII